MKQRIFLGLGTNLGDKKKNLEKAREKIAAIASVIKSSPIYETPPFGIREQPDFYNQVLEIETNLSPEILLEMILAIEKEMGRVRIIKNGPRIIDIDILFYGNEIIKIESLQIPHPGAAIRPFVLVPLHEIAAEFVHPETRQTVQQLLSAVSQQEIRSIKRVQ